LTCDMMWTLGRLGQERLGGAECRCQAAHLYWR
jgi:hypothetical protein